MFGVISLGKKKNCFYVFILLKGEVTEREQDQPSAGYSSKALDRKGQARPKPCAWNSILVSHMMAET